MNGIVSGIEDDCEIISNEDIIKMTEDNNKEKHCQGINYDANNVQSGLNLENSTFKLMKDDDDI
jgi:hypothetical protein